MTESDEPITDLTALMSLDPLDLGKQDLDRVIAYQRKQRVAREGGAKTKKATGEAPKVDIKALMGKLVKPLPGSTAKPGPVGTKPPTWGDPNKPKPTTPAKGFIRRF